MKITTWLFCLLTIAATATAASAGTLVVDGDTSDWGVYVGHGNTSNMNSYSGHPGIGLLGFVAEDQDDFADVTGYLGPLSGGQDYDAEFLAAAQDGGLLHVLLVSGQRPGNSFKWFGPGDLRIETSAGTYGLEVGGGPGGPGAPDSVVEGDAGTTYTFKSNGYTLAANGTDAAQTAGSLWFSPTWLDDPIAPFEPTQMEIGGGLFVGLADYVFTLNSYTWQHSVIELAFDPAWLDGELTSIHWRPAWGNDELDLVVRLVDDLNRQGAPIGAPLPAAAIPGFLGLVALGAIRRFRRRAGDR